MFIGNHALDNTSAQSFGPCAKHITNAAAGRAVQWATSTCWCQVTASETASEEIPRGSLHLER